MAKVRTSAYIREIFYGVRLNITIAIIVLVAASIFVFAFVLLQTVASSSFSSNELEQVINSTDIETQTALRTNIQKGELLDFSNSIRDVFVEERVHIVLQLTPLIILAAGVIAYAVARQILRPIRESYNAQERFMQDAAHEFRNPLAALKVTVQNIKAKGHIGKDEALKLLKSTETQVNRLISINEDLLYLEKNQKQDKKLAKINASELLLDVLEDLQSLANQKNIEIIAKVQENIMLKMPAERFVKIAQNIIGNAIKYSKPDSGEIRVSLSEKGSRVRFSVRDFGVGIPSEDLAQIGRRFYRASNTSEFDGSGLGMAIVQKVVSAHGGTLTVNSKVNEGTHVVVNL